jgi:ubiquinone/menaquinone biosynthesis C-methylase UbiE
MERVLEPEVMDTADEAADYDAMDHAEVNARFCEDLLAVRSPLPSPVLDVGTGTARIPIELCARAREAEVVAIDLADHMLALARTNVERAGLASRVRLERVDAKALPYADGAFGAVVSNSIVHHIPDPRDVLSEMWRVTAHGGVLFVRDLTRPPSIAEVDRLVALYGGDHVPARDLFRASLRAALTPEDVAALTRPLGIEASAVRMTSDRHWTLSCVKP